MKKNILKTLMALSVILTINNVIAAIPNHTFNYQGQLLDNGSPANGSYDITVTAFGSGTAIPVFGKVSEHLNVSVTNGLFHLSNVDIVADNQNPFDGWDLYLEIAIKPSGTATYETLSPRQQLHAVPYANNLTMKGATDGQMLVFRETMQIGGSWEPMDNPWISNVNGIISNGDQVRLTRTADADLTSNSGALVIGDISTHNIVLDNNEILARNGTAAAAMYIGGEGGMNIGASNDNKGLLVIGHQSSQLTFDGNGIQQKINGVPGKVFLNAHGGDVIIGNSSNIISMSSDVKQLSSLNGMMKYMVFATCSNSSIPSNIIRSYNGTSSGSLGIYDGSGDVQCVIYFPTNIDDRFWQASPYINSGDRGAHCTLGGASNQLNCYRYTTSTGANNGGDIMVLVY